MIVNFLGPRSVIIVALSGLLGLFLAGVEILLSAYIVQLLALIAGDEPKQGVIASFLSFTEEPAVVLFGFVLVAALRSLFHIAKGYFAVSANELFVARLRLLCISSTLSKHGTVRSTSNVYSLISDVFLKSANSFYGVAHTIPLVVQALALLVFLFSISVFLSFVGLVFVVVSGLMVLIIQRKIATTVGPLTKINDSLYGSLKRILDNLLLIRFCSLEQREIQYVGKLLKDYLGRIRRSNLFSLLSENVPSLLGALVIALLFHIQLVNAEVPPEFFTAFVYLFVRFLQCLSQVVSFLSLSILNFPYFSAALKFYRELPHEKIVGFDSCLLDPSSRFHEELSDDQIVPLEQTRLGKAPFIEVLNLDYFYDDQELLFSNLSFQVNSGACCVIVGPSGVGKSTLLNLLVGELQPVDGEIEINGVSPDSFFSEYSGDAAYAGPDPFLFEGSIKENLLYGVKHPVGDREINSVLEALGLSDWLKQCRGNLDLPLGSIGAAVSSGQAQRLSIARALLRKPRLLILDEITANLDLASERAVIKLIEGLRGVTTTIIVTHSQELLKCADVTLDLSLVRQTKELNILDKI